MITFDVRMKQTFEYCIYWDVDRERYEKLFLHYSNISQIIEIDSENVISLKKQNLYEVIPILPSKTVSYSALPKLPFGEYVFQIKNSEDPDSPVIQEKKMSFFPSIEVVKGEETQKDKKGTISSFSMMYLRSKHKIPRLFMKLYISNMEDQTFLLPEMKRVKNQKNATYQTGCLVKRGESRHIEVKYGDIFNNFVRTTEE